MPRPSGLVFVVIGAGAMGRIVVRDLMETAPDGTSVVVGDIDKRRLHSLAASRPRLSTRVRLKTAVLDARDTTAAAQLFTSARAFGVINAAQHDFNLAVMDAAFRERVHYCDLGGLFHVTRKQLVRHDAWKKIDRLALLGMGAAPGIVNVMARSAADPMEEVREIHVVVASAEPGGFRLQPEGSFPVSYSIQTVIEEATLDAAVFTRGQMTFVPALSGETETNFPRPVGRKRTACTIHSEVATLPRSYKSKGLRECSFRIAFPAALVDRLRLLRSLGLLSEKTVGVGDAAIAPRDFVLAVLRAQPAPSASRRGDEYEILRVVVRGVRNGRSVEETLDCHTPGMPKWGIGSDINTGSPPSIVMQMLASGEISSRGCLPPERAVPVEPFFQHLAARGMIIKRRERTFRGHD